MADEPDNLILVMLRRIEGRSTDIETKIDRLIDDVSDLKVRTTNVEENLTVVHRRLDRIDARMDRVERRLGLIESAH